uniref:Uncharacterized protein n=1 Tax=Serratia marcescens TaxID=615 RepID=A0A1C3HMA2_SERMA|nr:Uncharacterised protein [Serratia marcescens]
MLFCLHSGLGFSQPDKFPAGKFELNIGVRPSAPYSALQNYNADLTAQGSGPSFSVTVSRHHIIPFNMLRSFYNRVAERGRLRNLSGFLNTYSNNLYLYASSNGVDCGRLGNDLVDAGNLGLAQGYGMATAGGSNPALGFDTFEQFYAWLPGNLFIGPNNRSDDPHEGFETNAAVVVGAANFDIISRVYRDINLYLANNDDALLNSISVNLSRMSNRKSIYNLNPNDWEFVNGQYRLSNSKKSLRELAPSDNVKTSDECKDFTPTFMSTLSAVLMLHNKKIDI